MILTPQRSHTRCTLQRRQISLDFLSARYFTVRRCMCPSIRANLGCPIIVLGVVIALFFQCMGALLNPANRAWGGMKWPLVAHITVMFSFATIYTAMNMDLQSISYIGNREFPGGGVLSPGPLEYQFLIYSKAINVVPNTMFFLNTWLANGLLASFVSSLVVHASNVGRPSFIVAASFMA